MNYQYTYVTAHLILNLALFLSACDDESSTSDLSVMLASDASFQDRIAGEMQAGEMQAGEMQAGEMQAGEMLAGEIQAGEMQAGEMQAGEMQAGEMQAGEMQAGEMQAGEMQAGEPSVPNLDYIDLVVDFALPNRQVWAQLVYVDQQLNNLRFAPFAYKNTGNQNHFWPASTIKMYAATGALELLDAQGFSVSAVAHFYRQINGVWQEELSMSFREMIQRTFNCSSNETYTLLLRFLGVDWINQDFFNEAHGFRETALMRDYVLADARPWAYNLNEDQRIVVREGSNEWTREHRWSGRSYADERGCTVYNQSGDANCTSPRDMAEHLRRLMYHESLPVEERLGLSLSTLRWYRGEENELILNNVDGEDCGGPAYEGVLKVFSSVLFHHKEGLVSEYRGSMYHVHEFDSEQKYIVALMIDHQDAQYVRKLSEELARMIKTPGYYVHLDYLQDYVNPITAHLSTISTEPGLLELMIKPYNQDPHDAQGWLSLEGSRIDVNAGASNHFVESNCLQESAQWHIRGRFTSVSGQEAWSDLHYVIVDHQQNCVPE